MGTYHTGAGPKQNTEILNYKVTNGGIQELKIAEMYPELFKRDIHNCLCMGLCICIGRGRK